MEERCEILKIQLKRIKHAKETANISSLKYLANYTIREKKWLNHTTHISASEQNCLKEDNLVPASCDFYTL